MAIKGLNNKRLEENLMDIQKEMDHSVYVQKSSSSLLLMNVEDILGYAQIKANKFNKNSKQYRIKRAIDEIQMIQKYKSDSQNIKMEMKFVGFPRIGGQFDYMINSDEMRIKQVLINLQSNALKFTKAGGSITVTATLAKSKLEQQIIEKNYEESESESIEDENKSSEAKMFEKLHGIRGIYKRHATKDKLVIKVQDTGIGIKKADKLKLFRLFGKL